MSKQRVKLVDRGDYFMAYSLDHPKADGRYGGIFKDSLIVCRRGPAPEMEPKQFRNWRTAKKALSNWMTRP